LRGFQGDPLALYRQRDSGAVRPAFSQLV